MRKLFALFLVATFILGDYTISHLNSNASSLKDERAESLLSQARAAIGGEAAINAVSNLLINGSVSHKVKFPDNQEKTMTGKVEMALETSGKLHKKIGIGEPGLQGESGKRMIVKSADVIVHRKTEVGELAPEKIQRRIAAPHGDDFSRLLFGLLLKNSPALGAAYNYLGEGAVDGTAADIVEASGENGTVKLYLDRQSHLPLMISYRGVKPLQMFIMKKPGESVSNEEKDVVFFNHRLPEGEKAPADGQTKVFVRKMRENGAVTEDIKGAEFPRMQLEEAEIQLRFSDYRSVNGLMLPHRLVEVVNGQEGEVTTIESYQINAPNLAEKFKAEPMRIRAPKIEKID